MKTFACLLIAACTFFSARAAVDNRNLPSAPERHRPGDSWVKNSDSPTIKKARVVAVDIQEALAGEKRVSQYNRILVGTCSAIIVLALLALLASCIRFTRNKAATQGRRPARPAPEPPPRHMPPAPAAAQAAAGAAHRTSLRVLRPASVETQPENALPCPECGALLECPSAVREADVLCGSCRKAFHVH